jgi:Phage tail lysozyme/CHAP domain
MKHMQFQIKNIVPLGVCLLYVLIFLSGSLNPVFAEPISEEEDKNLRLDNSWYTLATSCDTSQDLDGSLAGKDNIEKAMNFFVTQAKFSPEQAAGIIGNFMQESSVNPKRVEDGWGFPKESDTVPPATGPQGQPGYGIAQWTSPGRKQGLRDFAGEKNMKVNTLSLQLLWVMEEMKKYPGLEQKIKAIKSGNQKDDVTQAAFVFHNIYEGSADTVAQVGERAASGMDALAAFGSGGGSGTSVQASISCSGSSASGGSIVSVAEREYNENKGITEYGGDISEYTTGRQEAWCADFVSWVHKDAGTPFTDGGAGGWQHPSVLELQSWFQEKQTYFKVGSQPPQPGDVAFYIGAQTPDGGSSQHVNIVVAVNGSTMTTIGGNESDQIKKGPRQIKLGASGLIGFGRMK